MILLSNNEYNLNNYAKSIHTQLSEAQSSNLNDTTKSDAEASLSSKDAHFSETAAVLSLSKEGYAKSEYAKAEQAKNNQTRIDQTRGESKLARIQRYMSRSLQLENEASREDITLSERQTIQHEINKITYVVNNINDANENSTTKLMENSLKLFGNVVSHNNEQARNQEAYYARRQMESLNLYI